VLISAFNSLTCRRRWRRCCCSPRRAQGRARARIERVFGGFFGGFNARFKRSLGRYSGGIGGTIARAPRLLVIYGC
jgi:hypothetical protein